MIDPKKKRRAQWTGTLAIIFGIVAVPIPILQGWIFIAVGLSVLSVYSPRVKHYVDRIKSWSPKLNYFFTKSEEYVERVFGTDTHILHKLFIQNTQGDDIAVLVEEAKQQKGIVVVLHDAWGFKEQVEVEELAAQFREKDYTVVRFDARSSRGESEDDIEQVTRTTYSADLETVLAWSTTQPWCIKPVILTGLGLGAICAREYVERNPTSMVLYTP